MDVGTDARDDHGDQIVALGIAAAISRKRPSRLKFGSRIAYLVHSLKHPAEVRKLRELYPRGFYLIGLHSPPRSRIEHLCSRKGIDKNLASKLMHRDRKENLDFGQQLVDTFHLADFFTGWRVDGNDSEDARSDLLLKNSIHRFIEILFGHPNKTPSFGEYAMYLAFSAALRSADLSRQVGAVIARDGEILAAGANDCPRFDGGLYWPVLDQDSLTFIDEERGRDWTRGEDSNRKAQTELIRLILSSSRTPLKELLKKRLSNKQTLDEIDGLERGLIRGFYDILKKSKIRDLTEYGRVVHAEMEALLSCARKGVSTRGATLYSTTFPCHNCAKHIIAAGINRVVFVEPYLKSKALDLHDEAIEIVYPSINKEPISTDARKKVSFEPFSGIGPRRFFDLFSMDMSIGYPLIRKNQTGQAAPWEQSECSLRIQMTNSPYLEREAQAKNQFDNATTGSVRADPAPTDASILT